MLQPKLGGMVNHINFLLLWLCYIIQHWSLVDSLLKSSHIHSSSVHHWWCASKAMVAGSQRLSEPRLRYKKRPAMAQLAAGRSFSSSSPYDKRVKTQLVADVSGGPRQTQTSRRFNVSWESLDKEVIIPSPWKERSCYEESKLSSFCMPPCSTWLN